MARAIEIVPVTHPFFMVIEGSLRDQLSALVRLQNEKSGLWHTILEDPSSPLETSGSAGIATAVLTKGRLYNKYAQRAIDGVLATIAATAPSPASPPAPPSWPTPTATTVCRTSASKAGAKASPSWPRRCG